MNSNENNMPVTSRRAAGRSVLPRALRRPVDPQRLSQLIWKEGKSLSRAAHLMGVSINTVSIAVVRFGIARQTTATKIAPVLDRQVLDALKCGLPLVQVCAQTGVSLSSVYRWLRMYPQQAQDYRLRVLQQERLSKRRRFSEQAATTPMTACADYYWLRRNDSEWIAEFSRRAASLDTASLVRTTA